MKTTKEDRDLARLHLDDPGFLHPPEAAFVEGLLDDADRLSEWETEVEKAVKSKEILTIHRPCCAYCEWIGDPVSTTQESRQGGAEHAAACEQNPLVQRVVELELEVGLLCAACHAVIDGRATMRKHEDGEGVLFTMDDE